MLFVVDARAGVTPGDEEVAQILRESRKPVLVLANKIDDPSHEPLMLELHKLGLGDPIPVSGLHGNGTGDLLDEIIAELERIAPEGRPQLPDDAIRVAILGRPNVGKSSLVNALLGRERVIVSEIPGTTRDSVDTVLVRGDRTFVLIDTAGLRRKRRHRQGVEYYSELALDRGGRAGRRRARPRRLVGGRRGAGHRRRRRRAPRRLLDARWCSRSGTRRRSTSRTCAACSAGASASARRSSRSRRTRAAGSSGCSTGSRSSSTATSRGSRRPS